MSRHGNYHSVKGPTQRQLRVGEEVRHALAWVLERGDLRDPALAKTPITVTEVRVSPDMKNATCFVTPLGGGTPEAVKEVVDALERAKKFLRHQVANTVELKHTPTLNFLHDISFDEASHIDSLLHRPEVARDLVSSHDDEDADKSDVEGKDEEE